jgi:hypothetical protein
MAVFGGTSGDTGAKPAIMDCKYQDFGVSLLRVANIETDQVAIVLGEPTPEAPESRTLGRAGNGGTPPSRKLEPPQPGSTCGALCQAPEQPPGAPTATVTSDVDVYDEPGGGGKIIGILREGDVVKVVKACPSDGWCALVDGRFAYGQFFKNN